MTMRKVHVNDAIGMVVGHDLTKIVPGNYKGPAFRKGHIIVESDIPHLLDIGKEHIYIMELGQGCLHENEAAQVLAKKVAGENTILTYASEGRVNILASSRGWLKINAAAVHAVNKIEGLTLSTLHSNQLVEQEQLLAAAKIIPLVIHEDKLSTISNFEIIGVKKFQQRNIGVVITGNEVYYGRIKDRFAEILLQKIEYYGSKCLTPIFCPDDTDAIQLAIAEQMKRGADIVIAAGGMSVDPDDVTVTALRMQADEVVKYGSAVLPGAMFMMAYKDDIPLLGLPACGMFTKYTILDMILPRVLCGETINCDNIERLGYGGLCRGCSQCHFPNCGFGKN